MFVCICGFLWYNQVNSKVGDYMYMSITDVIMMIWDFCKTQFIHFNLFGRSWDLTILQIWFIPCVAGLTISIVKHIYELITY